MNPLHVHPGSDSEKTIAAEGTSFSPERLMLMAGGFVLLLLGVLLIPVARGSVPGYRDGMYGLLLVLCSLFLLIDGKNPGNRKVLSPPLRAAWFIILANGYISCFIPGLFGIISRVLTMGIFGTGGFLHLLKSGRYKWIARQNTHKNRKHSSFIPGFGTGILLLFVAGSIALDFFRQDLFSTWLLAISFLCVGIAGVLSALIPKKTGLSSSIPKTPYYLVETIMYGLYMLILGCLLVPVYLGLLPFSQGSQLGLYLLLVGLQAIISGNILTIRLRQSRKTLLVGLFFAAAGTGAVMLPFLPSWIFTLFIGSVNLLGGLYLLCILWAAKRESDRSGSDPEDGDRRILVRLFLMLLLTAVLMIGIGLFMLVGNPLPGILFAVILACFGLVLLALQYLLSAAAARHLIAFATAD